MLLRGLEVERQREIPVTYKGMALDCAYRLDLVVSGRVAVELKSVARLEPIHSAQMLTYLRLTKYPVGLLINFNVRRLATGIHRFVADR